MTIQFWGGASARRFYAADEDVWLTAYLGGVRVPGAADVKGKPARKIDKKNGPGLDGSRLTDQGYESPTVTMTVTIATADEWDAWQTFEGAIAVKPGKPPAKPWSFAHPKLPRVKSVLVQSIASLEIDDKELGKIVVELVEWMNPGKAKITTPTSKGVDLQGLDAKPFGPPAPAAPSKRAATTSPTG